MFIRWAMAILSLYIFKGIVIVKYFRKAIKLTHSSSSDIAEFAILQLCIFGVFFNMHISPCICFANKLTFMDLSLISCNLHIPHH